MTNAAIKTLREQMLEDGSSFDVVNDGDSIVTGSADTALAVECLDLPVTYLGRENKSNVYRIEDDLGTCYYVASNDGSAHFVDGDALADVEEDEISATADVAHLIQAWDRD